MSSIATVPTIVSSPSVARQSRAVSWGRFALVGLATIATAVIANALVYYIAGMVVHYDPRFLPLTDVSGAVICTFPFAIGAVLVYAGLLRFTRRPARVFTIVSAAVFVVTLIPDFTYIPTVPGATAAQTATLVLMHIVAASVIVRILTALARSRAR